MRIMCITLRPQCGRGVRQCLYWAAATSEWPPVPVTSIDMSGPCNINMGNNSSDHTLIRSQILSCSSQMYGDTWDGNLHKLRFDRNQLQATGQSFHICVASPPDDGDGDGDDDDDDGAGDGCISIYVSPLHLVLGLTPSSQKHTETPSVLKYLDSTGYFQNTWWFLWNIFS